MYKLLFTFSKLQMQTKRICPMTLTLAMVGTLDPLIHVFVGLDRRMAQSHTQGIVTMMVYVSVTNIQMPCGDHGTQSLRVVRSTVQ